MDNIKTWKFQTDPFPCTIFVGVGDFERLAKRWGITCLTEDLINADAFYMDFGNGEIHLFFRYEAHSWTVAHEVSHAVDSVFDHVGVKNPDTETRAYMISHIIQKIYEKWPSKSSSQVEETSTTTNSSGRSVTISSKEKGRSNSQR